MEEDWEEEEIEKIEEEVDEICRRMEGREDCPVEICGDICEIDEEEELEEDMDLYEEE